MQMMYETIYKALVEVGLEGKSSPQDYLNFFCLGNREAMDGSEPRTTGSPTAANNPEVFLQSRILNSHNNIIITMSRCLHIITVSKKSLGQLCHFISRFIILLVS